jgi:hypothetical protein
VGTAQHRERLSLRAGCVGTNPLGDFYVKTIAATHNMAFGIIFSSLVSNLHLPRPRNPIILPRKVDTEPVGVRPFVKRELSP